MKKFLFILIACTFLLSGCGRSEEAKAVDEKIDSLTEITLNSKKDFDSIDKDIEKLSESDKKSLKNSKKLEKYRAQYNQLVFDDSVSTLEGKISSIGTPSLKNASTIKSIRKSYDNSSEDIQNAISNYEVLVAAEEELAKLEEKERIAHAKTVSDKISQVASIEEVSIDNSEMISNARTEYNNLTAEEKKLVENINELENAESKLQEVQKNSLSKLKHVNDEYKGVDYYFCSTEPNYINNRTYILPHIAKTDSLLLMRAFYTYTGSDWIFWDTVYIITDDNKYTISAASYDIDRDVCDAYDVVEYYQTNLTDNDIKMFRDIAYSKNVQVKFEGQYSYEYEIKENDKASMRDLLAAYDYLIKNN